MHHNVLSLTDAAEGVLVDHDRSSLLTWAKRYLAEEVVGVQSGNTLEAKIRDLRGFMKWFEEANGHLRAEAWLPRDTQTYLTALERAGRAPTTINRVFATLRRFARWTHEQDRSPFKSGLPTRSIKELAVDEPEAKKLAQADVYALFKAADSLVLTETHKAARPRRNRAILAVLYYTGLRVSELCRLARAQLDGKYLRRVIRKGKTRSDVFLQAECRRLLEEYLALERPKDDASGTAESLFLSTEGGNLNRSQVGRILDHCADEANKHRDDDRKIAVHPHRLRHTFGAWHREKSGSDTETAAALGHTGLKYVGRYARKTDAEREFILDSMRVGA